MTLPPGTILQLMYLKERLRGRATGTFIEIGVGRGYLSAYLLSLGWTGVGYELDAGSTALAADLNREAIAQGRYYLEQRDWLTETTAPADLIVSSMVLEHLNDEDESRYLSQCVKHLKKDGLCILLVPGSPVDWGIEDEIAGHFRRYAYDQLRRRLEHASCQVLHIAGLTYPLSNWLLPLSNLLVRRAEERKRSLTLAERTRSSGRREVTGKTRFPSVAALLLNEVMLYPFHLMQKVTRSAQRALVIYCEFEPRH